ITSGPIQYSLLRMTTFCPGSLPRTGVMAPSTYFSMRITRVSPCISYVIGTWRTPRKWPTRIESRCVVPPTRPVKMRVRPFIASAEALSSTNSAAVQLPRDMMPGRSIIRPTRSPERSSLSMCPSSMRMPAQVWQRTSVGGWSPSESTQGQNTVQLHDSAISPFKVHASVTGSLPVFRFSSSNRPHRPMGRERRQHEGDTGHDQRNANDVGEPLAGADLLECHHHAERCHPDHVHHANREHHQHHRPAATEAVKPLFDAEPEYAARRGRPVGEEERERVLTLREAGMFERAELIDAGADEDRARKQPARRLHT